jgi:phosphoglycerate dehydrogenase-like enzyme
MSRIAVCAPHFVRIPGLREEVLAVHPGARFNEEQKESIKGDELLAFLRGCDKAICSLEKIDDALLEALPELRVVSKIGVGLDSLDLHAMVRHGVLLGWTPGVNKRSVAELTLSYMINALRRVTVVNTEVRAGVWRRQIGNTLSGKTVGIIGCGHIGKEVAALLSAFGCRLLVHDIRAYPEFYRAHRIRAVDLTPLMAESDVVTLHLPLTPASRLMIGAAQLALMKAGSVLINTARGGIVDEAALKDALKAGRPAAAAFDVFAEEPWPDRELLALPNLLASTHIGASTREAIHDMCRAAIANLDRGRLPGPDWIPDWRPE